MNVQILFPLLFLSAAVGLVLFKALYNWIYYFPSRAENEVVPYLRSVDLENMKDLLNLSQEGYLRLNLSAESFRLEQRHRIALTLEYYARMAHNTGLLGEWANTEFRKSWKTGNREANATGRDLLNACVGFRMHAFVMRVKLHAWLFQIRALPFISIPLLAEARRIGSFDLVYSYEQIKQSAEKLSRACGSTCQQELAQSM